MRPSTQQCSHVSVVVSAQGDPGLLFLLGGYLFLCLNWYDWIDCQIRFE